MSTGRTHVIRKVFSMITTLQRETKSNGSNIYSVTKTSLVQIFRCENAVAKMKVKHYLTWRLSSIGTNCSFWSPILLPQPSIWNSDLVPCTGITVLQNSTLTSSIYCTAALSCPTLPCIFLIISHASIRQRNKWLLIAEKQYIVYLHWYCTR